MAKCSRCGTETKLYVNSEPICLKCDDEITRRQKEREAVPAVVKAAIAVGGLR